MIDMMELRYHVTLMEYNSLFEKLQSYLRINFPCRQLRCSEKKREIRVYATNALSKYGFEEIRFTKTIYGNYFVSIILRPKLLVDPKGYYHLTSLWEFESVSRNFNRILRGFLRLPVPKFYDWIAKRIEAAVDPYVGEQFIPYYIQLFKRGDIQANYLRMKETIKYWSSTLNMYLMAKTVTLNWYNRYEAILRKAKLSGKEDRYLDFSETKGILRFEKQVRHFDRPVREALNYSYLKNVVLGQYLNIAGRGHYYTPENAIRRLDECSIDFKTRMMLIKFLKFIDDCGSVYMARERFINETSSKNPDKKFNEGLKKLEKVGINPVLIPAEWGVAELPNLYSKLESELIPNEMIVIN